MARRTFSAIAIVLGSALLLGGASCSASSSGAAASRALDQDGGSSSGLPGRGGDGGVGSGEDPSDLTPRVRIVGRVDRSEANAPRIAWGGTRVIVRFKGAAIRVRLRERNIDVGPSEYDLTVDGRLREARFVPSDGEGQYELASGLAAGDPHVVELYRRTEAMVGVTQILGFEFPGGGELLTPPAWPDRRIEFLGDSESTGYGIDCDDRSEPFTGATQNEAKTFPSLVTKALEAESHNISFSGKGVSRNENDSAELFDAIYLQSIPLTPSASTWEFASWTPHVIWIGLGANDYSLGASGDRPPPDEAAFKAKYQSLIELVRAKNGPDPQIVCAVEGIVNDDYPPDYRAYTTLKSVLQSVVDERRTKGDAKIHFAELPRSQESVDLTGCASHPNAAYHAKAASAVAARVREITGW